MQYSILQIQHITQGSLLCHNNPDSRLSHLLIDSRKLIIPQRTVFFAFLGERHDGHNYIGQLYKEGVRNFVVSKEIPLSQLEEANVLMVENMWDALQALAIFHRNQFGLPTIGITGSNGKTVVKEWLFQLLHPDFNIVRSPKSFNSQIGVPLSVWQINSSHNLGLFEAGISRTGEMQRLEPIIAPEIGLFTNIGAAHSEGFQNIEQKIEEKIRLFEKAKCLIYCKDDERIEKALSRWEDKKHFSWSRRGKAVLSVLSVERVDEIRSQITAYYKGQELRIEIPFSDKASIENAIHCWSLLLYLNYDQNVIRSRMRLLEPVAMRLELKAGINDCIIVNDSYNSDLSSLSIALNFVRQQSSHNRLSVVLSDILQSGQDQKELYQQVAELLREKKPDRLFGIGQDIPILESLLPKQISQYYYPSIQDFLDQLPNISFSNESILLKGARKFEFERIANRLSQQLHRTVLEVNLNALLSNLRVYNRFLNAETKMMAMVKASAYGSGSIEVARLLEFHQIDYLAVAYADEGVELRKAGIQLPILVLNPEEASFNAILQHKLEAEIYNNILLKRFVSFLGQDRESRIHLKLDTGMHRLGFEDKHLDELLEILNRSPRIKVASVFSHLAASDAAEHDVFTRNQIEQFQALYEKISRGLGYRPMRHILNSGGIIRFPPYQMEMVRLGLGLYGIDSTGLVQDQLQVVNTLKASISQVKDIAAQETVGYNRSAKIAENKKIATISIGYADGLPRASGNGNYAVFLNGQMAPIVGNVCMDMCMIDVTHIEELSEGDEVEIFGPNLPVEKLAHSIGTIPYEIFTGISARVKRIYFQE